LIFCKKFNDKRRLSRNYGIQKDKEETGWIIIIEAVWRKEKKIYGGKTYPLSLLEGLTRSGSELRSFKPDPDLGTSFAIVSKMSLIFRKY
jgi:hypothetical protein